MAILSKIALGGANFAQSLRPGANYLSDTFNSMTGYSSQKLAEEQFAYNKELNALQMGREDTTYQRTIADMEAAGLNPALLYGGSSGNISSSAGSPSSVNGVSGGSALFSNIASALSNIATMGSKIDLAKSETDKNNAAKEDYDTSVKLKNEEIQTEKVRRSKLKTEESNVIADTGLKTSETAKNIEDAKTKAKTNEGHSSDGTYQGQPQQSSSKSVGIKAGPVNFNFSWSWSKPYDSKETDFRKLEFKNGSGKVIGNMDIDKSETEYVQGELQKMEADGWKINSINGRVVEFKKEITLKNGKTKYTYEVHRF